MGPFRAGYPSNMRATPARIPDGPSALVVPEERFGKELLLTEVGYENLAGSLGDEDLATRIASGSLFAGSLFMALAASSFVPLWMLATLLPLALVLGGLWGRQSFRRKLRRLGEGHVPRGAVLGGGSRELLLGSLALGLVMALPIPPAIGLTFLFLTAGQAISSYGSRSRLLASELRESYELLDQDTADLLEISPGDLTILGQGTGEQGQCPVCGDDLGSLETNVYCELCGTGHHPECWAYAGRCSVFGCRGENVQARF